MSSRPLSSRPLSTDPFAALDLPARPDLTDEQVRAAWRAIAAATHPDRRDGGNIARYTAAAAAYAQLRTAWARSEAYADLETTGQSATLPLPAVPPQSPEKGAHPTTPDHPTTPVRPATLARAVVLFPARVRHGRSLRLAVRMIAAVAMSAAVLAIIGGQPAAPAVITGIVTWLVLTARADLAAPPGR
jgi:hypothetical protein